MKVLLFLLLLTLTLQIQEVLGQSGADTDLQVSSHQANPAELPPHEKVTAPQEAANQQKKGNEEGKEEILGGSGDETSTDITSSQGDQSKLPPLSTTEAHLQVANAVQPANWNFLKQKPFGSIVSWIYPQKAFKIFPLRWLTTYTRNFYTYCPQRGASLRIAGTGYVFVYLNGKLLLSWGLPWPKIHTVALRAPTLKCGCNNLVIRIYNYRYPSPSAVIYQLSQHTGGCLNCPHPQATFFNRRTCKCDCQGGPHKCPNPLQTWYGYPYCTCRCSRILRCAAGRYWNPQSCKCDCLPVCCAAGYYQNSVTCKCTKRCSITKCPVGYFLNSVTCKCIRIIII